MNPAAYELALEVEGRRWLPLLAGANRAGRRIDTRPLSRRFAREVVRGEPADAARTFWLRVLRTFTCLSRARITPQLAELLEPVETPPPSGDERPVVELLAAGERSNGPPVPLAVPGSRCLAWDYLEGPRMI